MSGEYTAFFYGTLMAPEVFYSVCYGHKQPPQAICDLHTFTPAILHGFCRHRVQFAEYPGIIPEEGHTVRGMYVTGLTSANVFKLDEFEGSEYDSVEVKVKVLMKQGEEGEEVEGEEKGTKVYVYKNPSHLEKREWDFEEFRREKMAGWTRNEWSFSQGDNENLDNLS